MKTHANFTDLVLTRAAQTPDRPALVLLPETGDEPPEMVSYAELDQSAKRLAGWLQSRGLAGERVLVLQSSRRLFASSFIGCLYAGAVAVPVPPAEGRAEDDERVAGVVKDTGARVVMTDTRHAPGVSQLLARIGYGQVACLAADAVPEAALWQPPNLGPDSLAFLQYTSGSTREPRGVMVTHGNILANQEAMSRALGTRAGDWLGGWLPFHHDMGLVGQLLHPLWLGGTTVLLTPTAFVKRPVRWLEAISRFGLSVSGAPDFAYELCVRRITDEQFRRIDLSRWEVAVNGGEPVRAETMRAFSDRFAPAGLRSHVLTPCYGLAEATLMVAGNTRLRQQALQREVSAAGLDGHELRAARKNEPARAVVSSGMLASGELRIVDPDTRRVLPDGRVGEIWLRGDSVAAGYWGHTGESEEVFGCQTEGGEGGFLRTGDLGALDSGQLYVTGRLKDMIVVAGRNLYPHDLESAVQRVSTLFGPASAFAVPADKERIVVVQELRARSHYDLDLPALTASVESCLAEEFEVPTGGVLLVRPGTVRRTSSGKVQRGAMRFLFLQGKLNSLHQDITPEIARLLTAGRR